MSICNVRGVTHGDQLIQVCSSSQPHRAFKRILAHCSGFIASSSTVLVHSQFSHQPASRCKKAFDNPTVCYQPNNRQF